MAGKMNSKPGKKRLTYPGRGRPRIYDSPERLAKGVEKYFASITVTEAAVHPLTGEAALNDLGEPVMLVRWLVPPTEGALARSLGITERTWTNYRDDECLGPVVEWAKSVIRDYLLEKLVTKEKGNCNGLIFALGNYGMKEQQAVEVSGLTLEEFTAGAKAEF